MTGASPAVFIPAIGCDSVNRHGREAVARLTDRVRHRSCDIIHVGRVSSCDDTSCVTDASPAVFIPAIGCDSANRHGREARLLHVTRSLTVFKVEADSKSETLL